MDVVERYTRSARWFHAVVYLLVLVLLVGGWWWVVDRYRHPIVSQDALIHEAAGLLLIVVSCVYAVARARAVIRFVRESVDRAPGDGRWFFGWPKAVVTGRFPRHEGAYDPGQRLANLAMLLTLVAIAVSGVAMMFLPGNGASFNALGIHRWGTFLLTPVIVGHILVASGVLPGYRGVWHSMHLGGRLPATVASRIWPAWFDRRTTQPTGRREP